MRTRLLSALGLLALLVPVVAAAQDDTMPDNHGRTRRHPRTSPGLREVSDGAFRSRRHGFWLSAGLGVGGESFDANDGLGWSDARSGAVGNLSLGGTVSPNVLLGVELNGWSSRGYQRSNFDRSLGNLLGIVQWYPSASGDFWLKGGVGFAHSEDKEYSAGALVSQWSRDGTAIGIGLGYDVPVGRKISVTPSLELIGQRFRDVDERLLNFGVAITFH
jgi:hypothetical protein